MYTEQDVINNQETVNIGFKVCYDLLKDGKIEEYQKELIECAFTTELKKDYVETINH